MSSKRAVDTFYDLKCNGAKCNKKAMVTLMDGKGTINSDQIFGSVRQIDVRLFKVKSDTVHSDHLDGDYERFGLHTKYIKNFDQFVARVGDETDYYISNNSQLPEAIYLT